MPRVSIVIVNYNGGALLRECAVSVAAQTFRDGETIVVDNGSTDDSLDVARGALGAATIVRLDTNGGFARGNNLGIGRARGDLVLTLNNDAYLAPTCLAELVAAADRHVDAGMFAPRILVSTDQSRIDSAGLLLYADGVYRARGWQELDGPRWAEETEVLFPCASVALYRRSMLDECHPPYPALDHREPGAFMSCTGPRSQAHRSAHRLDRQNLIASPSDVVQKSGSKLALARPLMSGLVVSNNWLPKSVTGIPIEPIARTTSAILRPRSWVKVSSSNNDGNAAARCRWSVMTRGRACGYFSRARCRIVSTSVSFICSRISQCTR